MSCISLYMEGHGCIVKSWLRLLPSWASFSCMPSAYTSETWLQNSLGKGLLYTAWWETLLSSAWWGRHGDGTIEGPCGTVGRTHSWKPGAKFPFCYLSPLQHPANHLKPTPACPLLWNGDNHSCLFTLQTVKKSLANGKVQSKERRAWWFFIAMELFWSLLV